MTMVQSAIAEDLEAYELVSWFTSAYLITSASGAPLAGRLATIFPPGAMVLGSAAFFALGSVLTSRARSFAAFTLGRAVAGVGGGGVMILSLVLVLQLTSRRRRGLFVGLVNTGFTVGTSAGAVVFGALLPVLGWRALFWVQAPLGILAGAGVYLSIPRDFSAAAPTGPGAARAADGNGDGDGDGDRAVAERTVLQKLRSIDYAGAALLTCTIVLFLYGLSGTIQARPMALAAAPLLLFVYVEYRVAADPLIPVSVLQSRGVLLSCLAQLGLMAARWTVLYYAPIFALAVRGLRPTAAGAVLVPTNTGFALGGVAVGWLHVRRAGSFWLPCLVCVLLFGLSLAGLSLTSTAACPAWLYLLVIFANGLCTGASLNYTLAHVLHLARPDTHFVSTGLLATFRSFAGSFGTTIGGGVFMRRLRGELTAGFAALDSDGGNGGTGTGGIGGVGGPPPASPDRAALIRRLIGSPSLVQRAGVLSPAEREVAVRGYEAALGVMYASAAAFVVLVLLAQAGTGWTEPPGQEGEDEIEDEIAEHDGRMEV